VVVHDRVVLRRKGDAPHHHEQQHAGTGGDPHPDPEHQGEADTEQAGHEEPVRPRRAGDVVVEALERSVRAELQEALGRAGAVDPRGVAEPVEAALLVVAGVEAERERLVQERPEEDPAERDAGGCEGVPVSRVARRLLVDRLGEEGVVGAQHRVLREGAGGGHGVLLHLWPGVVGLLS
jgi:hypothetical protein